jgi:hypothetical protein
VAEANCAGADLWSLTHHPSVLGLCLGALALLVWSFGCLYLLTLPAVLMAHATRLALGMYQYAMILLDLIFGGAILLVLLAQDYVTRLLWVK